MAISCRVPNMALSLLLFFFGAVRNSIFDYFGQVTLSHFSKFKIIFGMSLPCFC